MSELTFILADLPLAVSLPESTAQWPRLAALEWWLARGDRQALPGGWRPWLAQRLGGAVLANAAPAGIAAAARLATKDARHYWLATPVHFVAGLDTLRLHPHGLLRLSAPEQQQLAADFARVFIGSGWELLATDRRELLLAGPAMSAIETRDPATLLGADLATGVPRGEGAPILRRMSAEIEMWLHEHPVNIARQRNRQWPVSGLWLWGGGPLVARQARDRAQVVADDLYVEALAALSGNESRPWAAWPGVGLDGDLIVARSLAVEDIPAMLAQLERAWFAPMLANWSADGTTVLQLLNDRNCWRLARRWRFWRRPRPWWEALLKC